jgi:hypothetical protein
MARRKQVIDVEPVAEAPRTPQEILVAERASRDHVALVVAEYGDGLPWDPKHYEAQIRNELRRGFEALLRAGRYLVVARECAGHGEWMEILGRLGLSHRQAQRMMEASRRTANSAALRNLGDQVGSTKFFDLMTLPDEELARLADGEALDSLGDADEIEQMTTRELQAALRGARADIDAKDQVLANTTERLQREQERATKLANKFKRATPDAKLRELREGVAGAATVVEAALWSTDPTEGVAGAVGALLDYASEHGAPHEERAWLAQQVVGLIDRLKGLATMFELQVVSEWPPHPDVLRREG